MALHLFMIDSRFPMIVRISEAPAESRRGAEEVARRTGTTPMYNRVTNKIIWVYGNEVGGGPLQVTAKRFEPHTIDRMVEYIQLGKIPRREKDRIAESNARSASHERSETTGRKLDERRPEAVRYAEFLDRKRRGTQSVVVPV